MEKFELIKDDLVVDVDPIFLLSIDTYKQLIENDLKKKRLRFRF